MSLNSEHQNSTRSCPGQPLRFHVTDEKCVPLLLGAFLTQSRPAVGTYKHTVWLNSWDSAEQEESEAAAFPSRQETKVCPSM